MFNIFRVFIISLALSGAQSKVHSLNFEKEGRSTVRDWNAAQAKANKFIAQLTLEEKASMVTGNSSAGACIGNIRAIPRLGFGGLCTQDGPTALNRADLISVFPAGLTAAASWDKDLIYERGNALAMEFRDKGVHILLGPVAGPIGRQPLGGRNWEGFSPDPYLTGRAMELTVRGHQDAGVQAVSKHFIGNEQETQRSNTVLPDGTNIEAISANIDDRTLHELYLWPFADAVKAGTLSIMCSYNRVNETYACENSHLLNDILKTELGFKGYVMSDFFATHSGVKSIKGGLDMNMPGATDLAGVRTGSTYWGMNIVNAVTNGSLSIDRLDDMIRRSMTPYYLLGQDNEDFPTPDPATLAVIAINYGIQLPISQQPIARDVRRNHASIIRKLGSAGSVLLKNINSTLPLKSPKHIGVFGNDAADLVAGLAFPAAETTTGPAVGTLDIGGGSGSARHTYIVSPLDAIKARASKIGARVSYIIDNEVLAANDLHSVYPTPEVCLVFLKTYASEGFDRVTFEADWNSTAVVENVAARCPNTVVITHSAGINTMPWASNPNVTAIIAAHLPGEQSGNSIVDVLWGDYNPSGRLPYTIAKQPSDYNAAIVNTTNVTSATGWQDDFTDGQLIDYRHFDAKNITPLFEFGFGLSYTTFDIVGDLKVKALAQKPLATANKDNKITPGGNPELWNDLVQASVTISNTGSVQGATVAQLYVALPQNSVPSGTPLQVLRGFEKIDLKARETRKVDFLLKRRDLSFWDVVSQQWILPEGKINIRVGFSSRDIRREAEVRLR
ncbi:glycosyl hydrolase family 3 N terminal domain-containing protein [Bisporella sp. PMI_857]|nr:glycosyl hydrolase family 3 N terminal domain-containing protein [Bisporella sp. PMI_857]